MAELQNEQHKLRQLLNKIIPEPIHQITSSTGSKPGDNIIGKMLALQITTKSGKTYDLIFKSFVSWLADKLSPQELIFSKIMSAMRVFGTEIAYYDRIQPEMEKMVNYSLPTPQYYFSHNDDAGEGLQSCLILDDLRPKGYKMADKIGGLTSEETFMVLEKLAKFHAASYVYLEKAQVLKKAKEDILTVHVFAKSDGVVDGVHTIFMNGIYFAMIDILKEKKVVEDGLIEKILKFSKDPLETIMKGSRLSAEKYFYVVNHGDLWVNNFLFKYDENDVTKPIDVRFIDFQQCRYSSVFDELHYFLYTSTSVQFRKESLETCLHFYYDTFTTMLNVLNYPLPNGFTEEAFNSGYYEFLNAGFCYALMAVPFQVGAPPTPNEGGNEETQPKSSPQPGEKSLRELILSVFQSGPLKQAALNSSIAINRLRELCLEMDNLGVFNIE